MTTEKHPVTPFAVAYPAPWRIQGVEVVDRDGCNVEDFNDDPDELEFWQGVVEAVNRPATVDPEYACPVCATEMKPGHLCATDIELGTCHAACLEGTPVVDLDTGEPSDGPISTYPYSEVSPSYAGPGIKALVAYIDAIDGLDPTHVDYPDDRFVTHGNRVGGFTFGDLRRIRSALVPTSQAPKVCKACNGRGTEADWVGLEMQCVEVACSACAGMGTTTSQAKGGAKPLVIDDLTEAEIDSRARHIVTGNGWKLGDRYHLPALLGMMKQIAISVMRDPPVSCAHPDCGCDFDAVCNAALRTSAPVGKEQAKEGEANG